METVTFTMKVKDEITSSSLNEMENRYLFLGYLFTNSVKENDTYTITLENLDIAEKIFKTLKYCYHITPKVTVRTQKKFHVHRFFIFEIKDEENLFESELDNLNFADDESKKAFVKGLFLANGSINNPNVRGYHLEMSIEEETKCKKVLEILNNLGYSFKMIKRERGYMLYLKASEEISDFLKLLGSIDAMFEYEDVRIYRDHRNMVNRLNNCEQANLEKSINTGNKQLKVIEFLRDNDYLSLLDEKTRQVAEYRLKYPEESFQSFAEIISSEIGKPVSKSYVNHHFRKLNDVYDKIIRQQENEKNE